MWNTVVAVLGTLSGSLVAGMLAARSARADRRERMRADHRRDQLAAVTSLAKALADHRLAMFIREERRLTGADEAEVKAARDRSHDTRSAITAPLTGVGVLVPVLYAQAKVAEAAAYALRDAPSMEVLADLRKNAIATNDQLIADAGALFGVAFDADV